MISLLICFYFVVWASFTLGLGFGGNSKDDALPVWLLVLLGMLWPFTLPWLVGARS